MRIQPQDVTPENVDQAKAQLLSDMKGLITRTRRDHEMLTALANRTGNRDYRVRSDALLANIMKLDKAVATMLESS